MTDRPLFTYRDPEVWAGETRLDLGPGSSVHLEPWQQDLAAALAARPAGPMFHPDDWRVIDEFHRMTKVQFDVAARAGRRTRARYLELQHELDALLKLHARARLDAALHLAPAGPPAPADPTPAELEAAWLEARRPRVP